MTQPFALRLRGHMQHTTGQYGCGSYLVEDGYHSYHSLHELKVKSESGQSQAKVEPKLIYMYDE